QKRLSQGERVRDTKADGEETPWLGSKNRFDGGEMVIHSGAHARFYSAQSIFAACGCLLYAGSGNALGKLADGTDLNASNLTGAGSGYPGSPSESFVEIFAVEDIV